MAKIAYVGLPAHGHTHAPLLLSRTSRPLARYLDDEFAREQPDLVIYDSAAM